MPVPGNEGDQQKVNRLELGLKLVTEKRDVVKKTIDYFTQPPKK